LFADAPGPRVNPAAAPRLGNEVPAGATVASARHRITFSGRTARLVVPARSASSWAPMMTAAPAFAGSALWFLGDPTSAGMHAGTLRFTAATAGNYEYLCTVPSHAQKGMRGV